MVKNKKAMALINKDSLDVNAILLLNKNVEEKDIIASIEKTKKENPEWQLSDILEAVPADFTEFEFGVIYF